MKKVPNLLSIARIIGSILLLIPTPFKLIFIVLYSLIGLSDILDGYLARKLSATSSLGAKLDSIGDLVFAIVLAYIYLSYLTFSKIVVILLMIIVLLRIASFIITLLKYHKPVTLHTILNKATGLAIFIFPFLVLILPEQILEIAICGLSLLASTEEMLIHLMNAKINLNQKSIILKN